MPWLNWSLKLHIRPRTISLLISTHNTQVYVQWMPYSFVWLYLMKCVFTCSIFVDSSIKRFLSVLGVFGKYFVLQKLKISKTFLPCFGDSVAGKSSRTPQPRARGLIWRLVREWKVQSWGVHRDFHGSARGSLASKFSSHEKHLENFSKLLVWSVLAGVTGDYLATFLSHEKRVFCIVRAVFKIFLCLINI